MTQEMKYAFRVPGHADRVRPIDTVYINPVRPECSAKYAQSKGFVLLDWPRAKNGFHVEAGELPHELPDPPAQPKAEAPADPAKAARLERFATLLNADTNSAATRDDLMALAASDLDLDTAKAFVRGLPTETATESETKETVDMTAYRNVPNDERSRQRALEIKMMGVETRANAGDPKAAETWKSIRYAKTVALATGKPLFAVMADMGIRL